MTFIREIGRLLLVLALQVLLFDHLHIGNWGVVMMYVLFLINLPVRIPRWAEMLIGLTVGLVMDMWHSSLGIHIAACVALSFARPLLLSQAVQDIERIKDVHPDYRTNRIHKMRRHIDSSAPFHRVFVGDMEHTILVDGAAANTRK